MLLTAPTIVMLFNSKAGIEIASAAAEATIMPSEVVQEAIFLAQAGNSPEIIA